MQPTTEILARISRNSLANKEKVFTRLYRYLLRPDLYFLAYQNLYANSGAATKGANEDTADGFSETKIAKIIQKLADETYQPMPVRRTYIQKRIILRRSGLLEFQHSQTSWYRKFCKWFLKQYMNLSFCRFPMDSDPKEAAIPH
nr:hypothetical protein [Faecalibacterium sp. An77]